MVKFTVKIDVKFQIEINSDKSTSAFTPTSHFNPLLNSNSSLPFPFSDAYGTVFLRPDLAKKYKLFPGQVTYRCIVPLSPQRTLFFRVAFPRADRTF